jgi:hypothetical protein
VSFRDPSVSFEISRLTAIAAGHLATLRAEETLTKLQEKMAASNPLRFYLLIDALQRMMRHQGPTAHGYDPLQELVGGVLTSFDPETVMARRHTPVREDDFTEMELLVRQLAALGSQARVARYLEDKDERGVDVRFLLAAEEQFDRTAGYTEFLRIIASDVLMQLDDLAPEVGFRLSDVIRAADAHLEDQISRVEAAQRAVRREPLIAGTDASPARRSRVFSSLERIASVSAHDPKRVIAKSLDVDLEVASRLLDSLATPLGSQRVTSLTASNRLRQFPVVKLLDGTYIWASPQDCLHEVLEWADLYLAQRAEIALRNRLSRARAATTERLTAQALADVYGEDRVVRNLEYREPDGSWVETDAVVDLGAAAVIVEAKSQRITPQGRSATAGRVRTKVEEFLVRPLSQTGRASRALLEGREVRARRPGHRRPRPVVVRRLIVNLDRVDPFVTHARELVTGATRESNNHLETDAWIVSLADLLAVAHLLPTPVELWAYQGKRSAQTGTGSPMIYMESDALGAWLKTREGAWPIRDGNLFQLAFSSGEINTYFNARDFASRGRNTRSGPAQPPGSQIPPEVLSSMTSLIDAEGWAYAADAIGDVPPSEWSRFRRAMRRLATEPTTRHQRRSRAAVERGIAYGVEPRVIIRPGAAARLEVSGSPPQASASSAQSIAAESGEPAFVTLTVEAT